MNRFTMTALAILVLIAISVVCAQQQNAPAQEDAASSPAYRVMSLRELFDGDDEMQRKIDQLSFTFTSDDRSVRVVRSDMDAADYERALNRWAKEGWLLVTVNKSNYWIFEKSSAR